jgi:hypothetical protein
MVSNAPMSGFYQYRYQYPVPLRYEAIAKVNSILSSITYSITYHWRTGTGTNSLSED